MVEPPEAALVLAGLYERLRPHLGGRRPPSWRTAELPAGVRIAWLRAELLHDPALVRREPPGELLYQAVRETGITGAHRPGHPDRLVAELTRSGDPVLRAEALRLAREGLYAGVLAPALVREHLVGMLTAGSADVVAAALDELTAPWRRCTRCRPHACPRSSRPARGREPRRGPMPRSRPPPTTGTAMCCAGPSGIRTWRRAFGGGRWNGSATWRNAVTSVS